MIAAYIRVSTDEQTTKNQRPDIERVCAARGWSVGRWYEETGSAVKRRPVFERMLEDAQRGKITTLLIWKIDRFGRSMAGNLDDVRRLDRAGVAVVSVQEPWMDSGGPARELLVAIFSWVAQEERRTLVTRTKAGMARARAEGVQIGRRAVPDDKLRQVAALVAAGAPVGAACAGVRYLLEDGREKPVSPATFRRWRAAHKGDAARAP